MLRGFFCRLGAPAFSVPCFFLLSPACCFVGGLGHELLCFPMCMGCQAAIVCVVIFVLRSILPFRVWLDSLSGSRRGRHGASRSDSVWFFFFSYHFSWAFFCTVLGVFC